MTASKRWCPSDEAAVDTPIGVTGRVVIDSDSGDSAKINVHIGGLNPLLGHLPTVESIKRMSVQAGDKLGPYEVLTPIGAVYRSGCSVSPHPLSDSPAYFEPICDATSSNVTQQRIKSGVHFSVLASQREQALDMELAKWGQSATGLLVHIGRAYVFDSYSMLNQAAAEYDSALEQWPRSHDLLIAAIVAHQRTGNSSRAAELSQRLPPELRPFLNQP